ncbi:hypothetical protein BGX28_007121 [Mortierella sp. GBA30]|nr:hypothetical protein BGX28_007121 [Mortierella sp. GBA30]
MSESTLISTLGETLSTAVATATTTLLAPSPTLPPNNAIEPISSSVSGSNEQLCDWIRSAADCRDAAFIRSLLIASSAMHGLVFLFGFWLLVYRNRGLNSRIVTELFIKVGTGVRPKPMDCIVFFTGIASLIKVGVNIPLILDVLKDMLWLRIAIEQTYWIFVAIGFSSYFVGLLYAMPVTTREGIFAIYQPETAFDARPLPPIHVLTPTTVQKNFLLIMGAVYPAIFGAGAGIASAVFAQKPGYELISKILLKVQYSNWVLILWSMAIMFFYYGLKYTFILRANIIIAEAALKAPKAAFGISNLRSASPARFLFIQLQITGFGGAAVTLLAGSLCMIWVLCREKILVMPQDQLPHTMAFFWTCAIAVAFFAIMVLIAIQSIRNRRRGLHEPTTSLTNSFMPGSGQKSSSGSGQKSSSGAGSKSLFSSQNLHQKTPSARSESEARLAQRSSGELSTLHSIHSMDRPEPYENSSFDYSGGELYEDPTATVAAMIEATRGMEIDEFNASHQANKLEQDRTRRSFGGSPARTFTIKDHGDSGRRGSEASSVSSVKTPADLRYSVYGGARPVRPISPPPSSSSPGSSSFPLATFRSSKASKSEGSSKSKSSRQPGPTSSQVSNNSSSHTASSNSHTLSSISSREIRYPTIYESHAGAGSEPYRDHLQVHPGGVEGPYSPSEYYELQGYGSKGLSPPPRAHRLPNPPKNAPAPSTEGAVALSITPMLSYSPGPARNTFMNHAPCVGSSSAQYSDRPRVGGGVRRKSLKGVDDGIPDPEWPLPPTIS